MNPVRASTLSRCTTASSSSSPSRPRSPHTPPGTPPQNKLELSRAPTPPAASGTALERTADIDDRFKVSFGLDAAFEKLEEALLKHFEEKQDD